ncbi:MAG TPA: pentapeptide repeat-containing protein [Thermoanaerobaculia bacterium]
MTLKQEGPIFFFSYARADTDEFMDRFFLDLSKAVHQRLTDSAPNTGYRDVRNLAVGDPWPEELSKALSTCRAFVCLLSPRFVGSEYCGKELAAFRHRMTETGSASLPLLLPVLWVPLGSLFEKLPGFLANIQYQDFKIGEKQEGLQSLMSFGDDKDYRKFLNDFANRIRDAVEAYSLPPFDPPLHIRDFQSAFEKPSASSPIPSTTAPSRPLRRSPRHEAKDLDLGERQPKYDFLSQVERVCRYRVPQASIERIEGDDPRSDYLLVTETDGGIVSVYPVGTVEQGIITRDDLDHFYERIDSQYRINDSGMKSFLVYRSEQQAHGDLLSLAAKRRVRLMSYIEYSGLIDFRNYLLKQTQRLEQDQIYPPGLYVHQRLHSLNSGNQYPDALKKIDQWLDSPRGRFVLILGDFGTGKTFLLHKLALSMAESDTGPYPILLQMRSLEKGRSLDALVAQHFASEQMNDFSVAKFRHMLEEGRIALLFDGFDELALRVTYERAAEHFDTLVEAAKGAAKVIVTSRRQHFISESQVLQKLGEKVELIEGNRIGILQPFDRHQVRRFLVHFCGSKEAAAAKLDLIDHVKDLLGLSSNPRMLSFIADLPEEQLRQAAAGDGKVTAASLYKLLVDRWLGGEVTRIQPKGAQSGLSVQDRWDAVTVLAQRLWQKTDPTVNLDELKEDTARVIQQMETSVATFQVGSGTLLVRDDEGNFSFLHQSILEFLVAQAAAEEIKKDGSSILLSKKTVSLLMIQFIKDLVGSENVVAWARQATRGNDDIATKNALQVLARLGEKLDQVVDLSGQDLSGQDLSDQNLEGANLERTNLSSAKLTGTRLRGARLIHANLRDADLTRADLSQADFAEANLTRARLLGTDLRGADIRNSIFERAKLIGASLDEVPNSADFFGSARQVPDGLGGTILFSSSPNAVAWNPTRTLLASAEGSVISLRDTSSGQLIRFFQGHQGTISSLVFSPEGNTIASASNDNTVRLWDTVSGREVRTFQGHQDWVRSVVFSPEGNILASASHDNTVRLWDIGSGRDLRVLQGHQDWVRSVAFSPMGNTLASASYDKTVRLWDIDSGREIRSFQGHQNLVNSVAFSLEGNTIASGSYDKTVRLWDTESGKEIRTLQGHQNLVNSVVFSPKGDTIASASHDKTVRLWDTESGKEISAFEGHRNPVHNVVFSPDGKTLASASDDNTVRLWDTHSGRETRAFQGHQTGVHSVVFSPDGNTFASASGDNTVRLWDTHSGREIRTFRGPKRAASSVAFSPKGNTIASAYYDNTVRLWDTGSGRELRTFGHQAGTSVVFSPDGNTFASASYDVVRLWDTDSGRQIRAFQGHQNWVKRVVFSPDGNTLASASYDNTVRLWDTASGREIRALHGPQNLVNSVAFSPDGKSLASADNTVRLWDVASAREIRAFHEHQNWVNSVVFSPDGKSLASVSDDKTLRLWDTASGQEIRVLQGHQDSVTSVVFSPDGNTLASASHDNTVRLWDVATGRCIVILVHLPEGWVAFTPDGRYKYGGVIAGGFWHVINLCRFEVGELDEWVPGLRLPDDASFFDLPPVPPWVQAKR